MLHGIRTYLMNHVTQMYVIKQVELSLILFFSQSTLPINTLILNTISSFFSLIIVFTMLTQPVLKPMHFRMLIFLDVLRLITICLVVLNVPSVQLVLMILINFEQQGFLAKRIIFLRSAHKHAKQLFALVIVLGWLFHQTSVKQHYAAYQYVILFVVILNQILVNTVKQEPIIATQRSLKLQGSKISYQTPQYQISNEMPKPEEKQVDIGGYIPLEDKSILLIKDLPWIQNHDRNIVYQTFNLGQHLKQEEDFQNTDYQKIFLESCIRWAGKEVCDLLGQAGRDTLQSDLSDREQQRFKLYGECMLKDFVARLFLNPAANQMQTYHLYQIENQFLELSMYQIRVIITSSKMIVFFFEAQAIQKEKSTLPHQTVINIFQTFILHTANYLNCGLILSILTYFDLPTDSPVLKNLHNLRISGQRHSFFMNNMRDHVLHMQNQLFFKISQFSISEVVEDMTMMFEENSKMKNIIFMPYIDLPETLLLIYSDQERVRQVLSCLFSLSMMHSYDATIKIDIKSFNVHGLIIQIKDTQLARDENVRQRIANQLKVNKKFIKELDLSENLELSICQILAYQLSGQFKRGIEFSHDKTGLASFTFFIESNQNDSKQINSLQETVQIKMIGQKKYYETSLSMMIAFQDSSSKEKDDSKYFSVSQLSKQLSYKQVDQENHSNFFSQISRIKQDSHPFFSREGQSGSNNSKQKSIPNKPDSVLQGGTHISRTSKVVLGHMSNFRIESVGDLSSFKNTSQIDFGLDSVFNTIDPPQLVPKLLHSVIKFKIASPCCSKVLLVDNDYQSLLILETIMRKFQIVVDKAFNGQHAITKIEQKKQLPCKCGNNSYLLYFLETNLPVLGGLEVVRRIKEQMVELQIDRGFAIACTGYVDLNVKLECFRNGMDYYLCKPFDLIELGAVIQYLQ